MAKPLVDSGRFAFVDFLSDSADIMRSLDVLVHTCEIEPFGRIAIEAMAAAIPVVGPTTGGVAETIVDGETGLLVPPGNLAHFVNAVKQLIDSPALRQQLGTAGRARAAKLYSLQDHVDRFRGLYQSITRSDCAIPQMSRSISAVTSY